MILKNYVVQLKQGNKQILYLPQRGSNWAFKIQDAGIFGLNEAVMLANKFKNRFSWLNELKEEPPAGYMEISICEIDDDFNMLSAKIILAPKFSNK